MRLLLLLIASVGVLLGQSNRDCTPQYSVFRSETSATTNVVTIQQPATAPSGGYRTVRICQIYVYTTVAGTLVTEQDGSVASATATTPVRFNPNSNTAASTVNAYRGSNSTGGTAVTPASVIAANTPYVFDGKVYVLDGQSAGNNITFRATAGSSASIDVWVTYREDRNQP